jgi:hypothetical protein
MNYQEYLQSDHWIALKAKVKKPSHCPGCTLRKPLQCHHMLYRGDPHNTKRDDLMWICADCHKLFHVMFGLMMPAEQRTVKTHMRAFTKYQLRAELWRRGQWPYPQPPRIESRKKSNRAKRIATLKAN